MSKAKAILKKIFTGTLISLGTSLITAFRLLIVLPICLITIWGVITGVKAYNFEQQLFECPLPFESILLEKDSACGRIDMGSGEQMDYSAIILIESPLSLSAVEEHYTKALSEAVVPTSLFTPADRSVSLFVVPVTEPYYQTFRNELHPFYFECLEDREDFSGLYYIFMRN